MCIARIRVCILYVFLKYFHVSQLKAIKVQMSFVLQYCLTGKCFVECKEVLQVVSYTHYFGGKTRVNWIDGLGDLGGRGGRPHNEQEQRPHR